ncbi:MAG: hypothetical protein HZA50_11710 [Planctomycetes bacterium]|nr:hypothetical protein [Planctomycetota bacterium]
MTRNQDNPAARLYDVIQGAGRPAQPRGRRLRPEKAVLRRIRAWLHARGLLAIHIEPGDPRKQGYHAPAGYPDLHTIVAGRYVGIECKAPQGRQSFPQRHWQNIIEKAGGVYLLARSVEDIRLAIEAMEGLLPNVRPARNV